MRYLIAVAVAACAIVGSTSAQANSLRSASALDGVGEVVIQVEVGGALAGEHQTATPLFAGDRKGEREFQERLSTLIAEKLKPAGIAASEKAAHTLSILVFGGQFVAAGCDSSTLFMIEISVHDTREKLGGWPDKTVLGVSRVDEASDAIARTALSAVDEFLPARK